MGDARHQGIVSDHNEGNAFDLTYDPAHGCDAHALVRALVARKDKRVKYVISNGVIYRGYDRAKTSTRPALAAWQPEKYTGTNQHTHHAHVSIWVSARDNTASWWGPVVIARAATAPTLQHHTLNGVPVATTWITIPTDAVGDGDAVAGPVDKVLAASSVLVLDKYDQNIVRPDGQRGDVKTVVVPVGLRPSGANMLVGVEAGPKSGAVVAKVLLAD